MAYFEPYIDTEGIHVPSYDDTLEYLIDQYKSIFGADVYIAPETPDYQLLSVFSKMITDLSALAIDSFNSRDPNYAVGNSLDVIVQLAGLVRKPATKSSAVLKVSGAEGTVVPSGSKAIDKAGYLWTISSSYTIPAAGYGNVNATCDTKGAIPAAIGTIDGIYTPIIGWSEVTNEAAAVMGDDVESDSDLRERFFASHSSSANGLADSMISGLRSISGVNFVALISNDTNSTDANGIPAHSLCALVDGGDSDEVAKAIYEYKSPGVGTYGSTEKTVVDDTGASHTVKFSRPEAVTVTVTVSIVGLSGYDSDSIDPIIKQAIVDDINSLGIGKAWNVTLGYKDVYSMFTGDLPVSITGISATNAHGTSTSVMQCDYDEILVTDAEHVIIST